MIWIFKNNQNLSKKINGYKLADVILKITEICQK